MKLKSLWIAIKNKYFFWKHRNDKVCRMRYIHSPCEVCDIDNNVLKNGFIGNLTKYRIQGKTYSPNGEEIQEIHEKECFCCKKNLLDKTKK